MKHLTDSSEYWNNEGTYYMSGLGVDVTAASETKAAEKPWYEKLISVYGAVKSQQTAQKYQDMLMQENLNRQKSGQPAISMQDFQAANPSARVDVGISPDTRNLLIAGGVGLLGLIAFLSMRKKR